VTKPAHSWRLGVALVGTLAGMSGVAQAAGAADKTPWTQAVAAVKEPRLALHSFKMKPFAEPIRYVALRAVAHKAKPRKPLPTVVLLHGLGGDPISWLELGRIVERMDRARNKGTLPPCLVLIPAGGDGYWADWPDGKHPYGALVLRVLKDAGKRYKRARGPKQTAIVGISMGGFGAVSLGLQHADRFGFVAGLSATDLEIAVRDGPIRQVYRQVLGDPPAASALARVNPHQLVKSGHGNKGQVFLLSHGSREANKFREGSIRLAKAMRVRKLSVRSQEVAGGRHGWASTWERAHPWWIKHLGRFWKVRSATP